MHVTEPIGASCRGMLAAELFECCFCLREYFWWNGHERSAQLLQRFSLCSSKCLQQGLCVLRRAKKMSGFDQTPQLVRRNQGDIVRPATMNDDLLSILSHFIQKRLQICTSLRVGGFDRHSAPRGHAQTNRTTYSLHAKSRMDVSTG